MPRLQALTLGTTRQPESPGAAAIADGVDRRGRHFARLHVAGGPLLLKGAGKPEQLSRATSAQLARSEGFSTPWEHSDQQQGPTMPAATRGAQPPARRPGEGHQGAVPSLHRGGRAVEGRFHSAPGWTRPGQHGCLALGLPASKS